MNHRFIIQRLPSLPLAAASKPNVTSNSVQSHYSTRTVPSHPGSSVTDSKKNCRKQRSPGHVARTGGLENRAIRVGGGGTGDKAARDILIQRGHHDSSRGSRRVEVKRQAEDRALTGEVNTTTSANIIGAR